MRDIAMHQKKADSMTAVEKLVKYLVAASLCQPILHGLMGNPKGNTYKDGLFQMFVLLNKICANH